MESILYRVHCTALGEVNRAALLYTVDSLHLTLYSAHWLVCSVNCAVQCTVYSMYSTFQTVEFSVQCCSKVEYSVQDCIL